MSWFVVNKKRERERSTPKSRTGEKDGNSFCIGQGLVRNIITIDGPRILDVSEKVQICCQS
jgi:hypothetical protein